MIRACATLLSVLLCAGSARAQDVPPPDILKAIVSKLEGGRVTAPAPATIAFTPVPGDIDPDCGLAPHDMNLSRGKAARKYSVLLDKQGSEPRNLFVQIRRLMVDADGSARAYHPEDPDGEGECTRLRDEDGRPAMWGVCALDRFRSGQIHLFRGADPLKKPELAPAFKDIWPMIRDRRLKSVALKDVWPEASPNYRLFHWRDRSLTAFFKRTIIPLTNDGYPCVHDRTSRAPGYFVAATTLTRKGPVRPDGCAPSQYIDAEEIPFFVLPGGNFGSVAIGDVVIGRVKTATADRIVYGVAGDIGPIGNFGEGSIAFNQALLGKTGEMAMNVREAEALDIDDRTVSILILGGTRQLFNGDYSRANIEAVGRREFARWNGGNSLRRIDACAARAKVNSR